MSDQLNIVWNKLFETRTRPLAERFPGSYRALVVDTNDPLVIGRIRFKLPDLHDYDLKDEDCPWAVPQTDMGGKSSGRFTAPCKGDHVWITFERQHPYGPIWSGAAQPTRRQQYPLPSIHGRTPTPVNDRGKPLQQPNDYNQDYLPWDSRPMSHGWQDRYGNLDVGSAVGFYPQEHTQAPPPPGHDAVQGRAFRLSALEPQVNNPDTKYMVRMTKYGNLLMMGDQGYYWKKAEKKEKKEGEEQGDLGEFTGDAEVDKEYEIKRWKYLQKFLNEGVPDSSQPNGDQRRIALQSRYGTLLEMRDVGWAQQGPIPSKSRQGEYAEPRTLSREKINDFRWFKVRTPGGFLLQAYDKGFHPQEDNYIKRKLMAGAGHLSEREDKHWDKKDARWWRMSTRYGIKLVLDDRGSSDRQAEQHEFPRGNGFLVKGRRSPAAAIKEKTGNPRGFYLEFNENDKLNHLTIGSPLGGALEINDRYEYVTLAMSLGKGYATKYMGLKENEFLLQPTRHPDRNPEAKSHHLVLDHENEYIRLKTRANKGPKPDYSVNPPEVGSSEEHQGFEARDGSKGAGPWVEVIDSQARGLWLSRRLGLGVWRGARGSNLYTWIDDANQRIVLYNDNDDGKLQIYSRGEVEVMGAANVTVNAFRVLNLKGGETLNLHGANSLISLINGQILVNNPIVTGGNQVTDLQRPPLPAMVEPTDRGATYNGPFEECPRDEVEHPT